MVDPRPLILLNPGPVALSNRVRNALLKPDLCHREPEFATLQASIRRRLLDVYSLSPARYAAVLLTGSGTAAVEAMLTSLMPPAGKVLVIENGVYGERLSRIAEVYGIAHIRFKHQWGAPVEIPALARRIEEDDAITHVAAVHHETTTGRLNDLAEVASLCDGRGLPLLVDGVSSFGAEALDFEAWNIGACAATANKCLHGVPGVSFVVLRRELLPPSGSPKRSLYLDLETYCRHQDANGTPFTQSVQSFYALEEALSELQDQGGWQARHQHYQDLVEQTRNGLLSLGIRPLMNSEDSSVVLNSFELPPGFDYETLHDRLKENGFVIYAGQGELAKRIFRLSTMGAITAADIHRLLQAITRIVGPTSP